MSNEIQILNQTGRWRARNVNYWSGRWEQIQKIIPEFTIEDFRMESSTPINPYLKTIVRQPVTKAEMPIPVGVVSHSYMLAQHADVANKCFEGVKSENIKIDNLDCEIGLTELGE